LSSQENGVATSFRVERRETDTRNRRAKAGDRRYRRQAFVDELIRDIPVYPVNVEIAKIAGRIEGAQASRGVTIAFEDLLMAATA
jgi:predicted nucleic acid-binding protein